MKGMDITGRQILVKRWKAVVLPALLATVVVSAGSWGTASAGQAATNGGAGSVSAPEVQSCPAGQCFTDVPTGNTFAAFVNHLYEAEIISGYACGGAGEPCDANSRPYYRPSNTVTRAQMTKFVDLARQKPGLVLSATAAEGDYFALGAFRDTPGVGGAFDGNGAIFAYNSGAGPSGTEPNAGIYAAGSGASNSVGIRAVSTNGQGAYIDTLTPSNHYGTYIEDGGMLVGSATVSTNYVFIRGPLTVQSGWHWLLPLRRDAKHGHHRPAPRRGGSDDRRAGRAGAGWRYACRRSGRDR